MAMTLCFIFLSACKPKTILDTTPLKAEIAQEFAKADKGDAAARFNIGLMYFRGEGVPQDYRQARVWFEKAAMQGLGEAQYNMGAMLEQGLGTEKNAATARTWYEKAAAQGNAHAQYKPCQALPDRQRHVTKTSARQVNGCKKRQHRE